MAIAITSWAPLAARSDSFIPFDSRVVPSLDQVAKTIERTLSPGTKNCAALDAVPAKATTASESLCGTLGDPNEEELNQERILARVKSLLFKKLPDEFRYRAEPETQSLLSVLESTLYAEANEGSADPKFDISPESVEKQAKDIAAVLIQETRSDPALSAAQKKRIADRLGRLKVYTWAGLMREPDTYEKKESISMMRRYCFADLSNRTAFSDMMPNEESTFDPVLFVCPGLAVTTANLRYKSLGLNFVISHELSHLISFALIDYDDLKKNPFRLENSMRRAHEKLLSCFDDHYGGALASDAKVIRKYKELQEAANKSNPLSSYVSQNQRFIDIAEVDQRNFKSFLGRAPKGIESHANELIADYWADRIAPKLMAQNPGIDFETQAASAFSLFCVETFSDRFRSFDPDEGIHPSHRFRIEMYLRNPRFRDAERKSTRLKVPAGPWCNLSGPVSR